MYDHKYDMYMLCTCDNLDMAQIHHIACAPYDTPVLDSSWPIYPSASNFSTLP